MTRLGGDMLKAKKAAAILLTSPGTPFIYYGEEIGMSGDKPDPSLRRPMQWTPGENAGFTTGVPWAMVGMDAATINVETQLADVGSLLSRYRKLIRIRGAHSALRSGALVPVSTDQDGLVAVLRVAQSESVLVLVNLTGAAISAPVLSWEAPALHGRFEPILLMGSGRPGALSASAGGSVAGFVPLDAIGANETIIIQYR
jgi:glycosidase